MKRIMIITALVMTAWTALAIQEDGLVLYFPFDEGAGDMAGDLSGSELVGVLNGVNWSEEGQRTDASNSMRQATTYSLTRRRYLT